MKLENFQIFGYDLYLLIKRYAKNMCKKVKYQSNQKQDEL